MTLAERYGLAPTGQAPASARRQVGPASRPRLSARPLRRPDPANRPQVQERPAGGEERKSIFGQIGEALAGVPGGIGHLGAQAGRTLYAPIKAGGRVLEEGYGDIAQGRSVDWNPWNDDGRSVLQTAEMLERQAAPLVAEQAESTQRTLGNVRHPERYAQAWREGRIVGTALEDIGNASIVAAGAGAVARGAAGAAGGGRVAGGLARGARALERTSQLGGAVADAPVSVFRRGGRAVGRAAGDILDTAPALERVRALNPMRLTSEGRQIGRAVRSGVHAADRAGTDTIREVKRSVERTGVSLDEQAAARALVTGEAAALHELEQASGLDPQTFYDTVVPRRLDESHLTQEGWRIAKEHLDETLDPEAMSRINEYADTIRREGETVTREALSGVGRRTGGLNEEYVTSNDPLAIAEARALAEDLPVDLDAPSTYAARWRGPMIAAQRLAEVAPEANLPRRPRQFAERGVEATYLPEGVSSVTKPKGSKAFARPMEEGFTIAGDVDLTSEFQRKGGGEAPYSARALADTLAKERRNTRLNATYQGVVKNHGRAATKILDPADLADIDRLAADAAARQGGTKSQQAKQYAIERGALLIERMAEAGFEPWPVKGKLDSTISPAVIDPSLTPFLPVGVKQRIAPYWNPRPPGAVLRGLNAVNTKFKGAVLPFSLRWQMGDAMSNMLMSAVGGVDPYTLFKQMGEVKRMSADPRTAMVLDQSIPESGLFFDEQDWLKGGASTVKADRRNLPVLGTNRPLKAVQHGGYKVNELSNRYQRQAFYLTKLQRQLDLDPATRGMSWLETADRIDNPKVQDAIGKAVNDTATFLGDMANLTPFEKRYMRQAMPFYPWARHVAKLAMKLPIDHPARLVFLMRIGELAESEEDLPPFLRGAIEGPGGYWQTSFMNPLADIEGGTPFTSPAGALRSLSPAVKVASLALTGANLNRGGLQATRPRDTGARDWYGRETINPMLQDPGALAYQLSRQAPFLRTAFDLAKGRTARYDTGEEIQDKYGNPIDREAAWRSLPQLAGLPMPTPSKDVEQIRATRRRRRKELRKAALSD